MTDTKQKIRFHFPAGRIFFPDREKMKQFLMKLFRQEGKLVNQIHYMFCSDLDLLKINKAYLRHNTLTDIITFPYQGKSEPILSDIYISVERVNENARLYNTSKINELYRVIFHGALHLCDYSDKTIKDKERMKKREDYYLRKYCST